MSDLYIGNRLTVRDMSKVLNKNASYLNNKLSDTLRSIALRKGIAKTQKGSKLMFYKVTKDEYEELVCESSQSLIALKHDVNWLPLIAINADELTSSVQKVNSNYPRRMDSKTHSKYLNELNTAMDSAVIKINEDNKLEREKSKELKGNVNNLTVGDVLLVREQKYYSPKLARITKTTEKSFWCEFILPHGEVVSNLSYALHHFKEVKVLNQSSYGNEFIIPYKINSEQFKVAIDFRGNAKTAMRRWDGEESVEGYRVDTFPSD